MADNVTVWHGKNSDGEPIEVTISREIVVVEDVRYAEPQEPAYRFGWEEADALA